jgi:hypothetical protein
MKNLILIFILFFGCNRSTNRINNLLESELLSDNMKAYYLIGEKRDTSFVPIIIEHLDDPEISHHYRFLGMSAYQTKIGALRKISGQDSPNKISYKPDSVNIRFYLKWAEEEGYKKE